MYVLAVRQTDICFQEGALPLGPHPFVISTFAVSDSKLPEV